MHPLLKTRTSGQLTYRVVEACLIFGTVRAGSTLDVSQGDGPFGSIPVPT